MTKEELIEQVEGTLDQWQMIQIRLSLKTLPVEKIQIYSDGSYTHRQMEQIRIAFMDGVVLDPDPSMSVDQLQKIRLEYIRRQGLDDVTAAMQQQTDAIMRFQTQIDAFLNLQDDFQKLQKENLKLRQDLAEAKKECRSGFRRKKRLMNFLTDSRFTADQLKEIRLGMEEGLSTQQMESLSKVKMPAERMKQLRLLFRFMNHASDPPCEAECDKLDPVDYGGGENFGRCDSNGGTGD